MRTEEISQLIYLFLNIFCIKIKMTWRAVAADIGKPIKKCALLHV